MIQDDAEYLAAVERLKQVRPRQAARESQLRGALLNAEEIERALAPMRSFHLGIEEEVEEYERRRRRADEAPR